MSKFRMSRVEFRKMVGEMDAMGYFIAGPCIGGYVGGSKMWYVYVGEPHGSYRSYYYRTRESCRRKLYNIYKTHVGSST